MAVQELLVQSVSQSVSPSVRPSVRLCIEPLWDSWPDTDCSQDSCCFVCSGASSLMRGPDENPASANTTRIWSVSLATTVGRKKGYSQFRANRKRWSIDPFTGPQMGIERSGGDTKKAPSTEELSNVGDVWSPAMINVSKHVCPRWDWFEMWSQLSHGL